MTTPSFGRLEKVDLRDAWSREDTHFTPWLAQPDNLKLLGETIGMDLEVVGQEQSVGPFRADILCKDTIDGSQVLIENQIERTDHNHLGQIITYAAGLEAVTIVWIAARFTDEHRAALDWLNSISNERIRFFGLEVELWRIGSSPVAPKFNVVARPNDWSKTVREAATAGGSNEHVQFRYEFWAAFCRHLAAKGSPLSTDRTSGGYSMNWAVGRTHFWIAGLIGFRDRRVAAALLIGGPDGHAHYHLLERGQAEIEAAFGEPLLWDFEPNRKASKIAVQRDRVDPMNREEWPAIHDWLQEKLEKLRTTFHARVIELDAEDWVDPETAGAG